MPRINFKLSNSDEKTFPQYYGYTNIHGDWYIVKVTKSGTIKYYFSPARAKIAFYKGWEYRKNLTYSYMIF